MSDDRDERPWRRRLQRYGPWVVAGVTLAAILWKYPPERIAEEMAQGDFVATLPYAALLIFVGVFWLSTSDWLVINGTMRPPKEVPVAYLHAARARAGMSLLGLLGYGAGVGGVGVWIARVTGSGPGLAGGVALYLMSADLTAVSSVAAAAFWIGRPDVASTLGIVAPILAAVLLLLKLAAPLGLLVPADQLPRVFQPWHRVGQGRALLAVGLRTLNICWICVMVWLAANAFGMPVPLSAMATFFPIILVVGSMPVNVAGFGAVQGAWLLLEPWARSGEQVIAFSVLWHLVVACAIALRGLPFIKAVLREVAEGPRRGDGAGPSTEDDSEPEASLTRPS
jgi:hypothetical protein